MRSTLLIITMVSLAICGCNGHSAGEPENKNRNNGAIVAQTFKTAAGWGYTVSINDKLFIKQSFIPVVEGNKGFAKEDDAIKVASLVVSKLKHHEKPTIRLDELQECGIVSR